uniref:Uncharacterized protein n=1 Tax=Arundo donax TaxID=35708 RepID=A0A0A9EHC4_ARUDO
MPCRWHITWCFPTTDNLFRCFGLGGTHTIFFHLINKTPSI